MRALHQIELTSSDIKIDHSKHLKMTDLTSLLVEGHEETKNQAFLNEIQDLSGLE